MTLLTAPPAGKCDICDKLIGNIAKHRLACSLAHGLPVLAHEPTEIELDAIMRAGSHALADAVLDYERQLHNGVTDLDMARLLLALDRDVEITQSPSRSDRWMAPREDSPLKDSERGYARRNLSVVANEAVRLGLAAVRPSDGVLRSAFVHLRNWADWQLPACRTEANGVKRYRLVSRAHLSLVDCQRCVDIAPTL